MNVELKLWLKDLVTDGIKRIDTISRSAFGGVSRSVDGSTIRLRAMGVTLVELRQQSAGATAAARAVDGIGAAAEDADKKLNKLNNSMNGGGGIFSKYAKGAFWGNMAADAVQAGVREVWNEMRSILTSGMESGAIQKQFEVLAGSEKGERLFADLKQYVSDSVFGPELYTNARTMLAFGIKPEDVMPDMKMLGDVAMGNKEKMDLLTLAFAQTTSAGKLMGQDLLQYINAGFNPLMVLAEKTGQSYESLKDKMSEGGISAAMVKQAFQIATSEGGKFSGMLDKMANTPFGKFQAMMGSLDDAKVSFGVAISPAVNRVLDGVRPMLEAMPKAFARMEPIVNQITDRFIDLLPTMRELGGGIADVLAPIGKLLLSDELGQLAKSVGGVTKSMLEVLQPVVSSLAGTLAPLALGISKLIDGVRAAVNYLDRFSPNPGGVNAKGRKDFETWANAQLKQLEDGIKTKNIKAGEAPKDNKAVPGINAAPSVSPNVEAITGGGKKVINIYLNKPAVEKQIFNVGSMQEAVSVSLQQYKEEYLRTLQGAVAAL